MDFRITYNEKQEAALKKNGFTGIANDPEGLNTIEFFHKRLSFLQSHNKNYTKKQYEAIDDLFTVIDCIIKEA